MKENFREPEVPEERVPVVECLDGHARITSKELAPIHSVNSGTLQNACSTRPSVVADLGKSALLHIVRLMNNLVKGPKRVMASVFSTLSVGDSTAPVTLFVGTIFFRWSLQLQNRGTQCGSGDFYCLSLSLGVLNFCYMKIFALQRNEWRGTSSVS